MRRRAALALLGFVALWPLVTLGLQARWSVDPWKLMGFGMYAAPGRRLDDVRLTMTVKRDGAWAAAAPSLVAEEAAHFLRWRRSLGTLVSPDPLARAVLAATNADAARVDLVTIRLDPGSARVVLDREVATAERR